jgi:uncharacterized protein
MKPGVAETLCTRCGLCCDGSLFADVELASRDEAAALEIMGLEVEEADEDDRGLLLQPCRALQGKRCSIYPHRPECCRTFECRLLQEVNRGTIDIEKAREKIAETLRGIRRIEDLIGPSVPDDERRPLMERCGAALAVFAESAGDQEANQRRAELQAAMIWVGRLIKISFLGH